MGDGEDEDEKKSEQRLRQRKMTAPRRLRNCSDQSQSQALSRDFSDVNFHFRYIWGLCEGER